MSELEDFNKGAAVEENPSGGNKFKTVLTVKLFQMRDDCKFNNQGVMETGEGIKMQFEGQAPDGVNFTAFKTQRLRRDQNGKLKNWLYGGGDTKDGNHILPSIAWEIKELCKEFLGQEDYDKLKQEFGDGKLTRDVFQNMQFEIDVKRIIAKDSGEYIYIPMFAYDRQRDEEYAKKQKEQQGVETVDPEEADRGIKELESKRSMFETKPKVSKKPLTPEEVEKALGVDPNDLPF